MRTWWVGLLLNFGSVPFVISKPQGLPSQRPTCTIPNIGLVGGDLSTSDGGGGVRTKDAAECKYECDRRAPCRFWSHVDDWQINCYLKAEAGDERKIDGATTGWKGDGCSETAVLELPHSQGLLDNSGCRIPGMALLGGDLSPEQNGDGITVRSFVECRTACRNQDGCKAYTFVKEWDANCFLKRDRMEESEFEGAISGTLAGCEDSDRRQLVRLPATSQSNSNSNQRLPLPSSPSNPSFPPPRKSTQRRPPPFTQRRPPQSIPRQPPITQSKAPSRFTPQQNPIQARPPPPPAPSPPAVSNGNDGAECTFENKNFLGGGLPEGEGGQGIPTASAEECSKECQGRSQCSHYTFVGKWKVNCYLKDRLGEFSEFEDGISGTYGSHCDDPKITGIASNSPSSSGVPNVPNAPAKILAEGEECVFENINFLGGGLSAEEGGQGVEVTDHQTCSGECQKNPGCHYWTFVSKWKVNCYLKSRLGEKTDFDGGISGSYGLRCNSINGNNEGGAGGVQRIGDECIFQETNFLGGGLPVEEGGQGFEASGYDACSKECRKRPQCHYWTFVEKWKENCYLKSRLGEKTEFEAISGTFGTRCDSEDSEPAASQSLPSIQTPSASSTQELIKDGSGCRYVGVNLLGGDMPPEQGGYGLETTTEDACRIECANRQNCNFWVFIKPWKVSCYLKEKKGPEAAFEGATSGSLFVGCDKEPEDELGETGAPRDNDHECAFADTNLLGADLPAKHGGLGINTLTAEECRVKCVQQRYCKHWVYVKDWRVNCYLKSDEATHQKKEGSVAGSIGIRCLSGAVSLSSISDSPGIGGTSANFLTGPRSGFNNPPIVVAPTNNRKDHCTYPSLNYQGGDLSDSQGGNGLPTDSPEDCSAECDKRSECQFWTHVKDWKVNCYLKSSFDEFSEKEGTTSGSIGVQCLDVPVAAPKPVVPSPNPSPSRAQVVPSRNVPQKPTSQPDNVCFFQNTNIIGGDLSGSDGGEGMKTDNPNDCAIACYQNKKCVYWVHVPGWEKNCFLKSHFLEEEATSNITSGSIGLACE